MLPREIFHHALSGSGAHARNNLRMARQMLNRRRDCIDIAGLDDDSFHAVAHNVAGFTGGNHRQTTSGRFVNRLGAAFQPRRKNVNGSLIEIILEIAFEAENANILAPEFFQIRLRFIVNAAEKPEFGVAQIQSMPCFEEMMNPLSLDQCARKNCAENYLTRSRLETLDIDAAWHIKYIFILKTS